MTFSESEAVFPRQIPVDPEKDTRAIFVHPDQSLLAPQGVVNSFDWLNTAYSTDRLARLRFMASSAVRLDSPGLNLAFKQDERDAESRHLRVDMSPLNDGPPESSPEELYEFITKPEVSRADINKAKPNSWSPETKLDIDYEFGHAEGVGMPLLQVYSREAPAFTLSERHKVASGDMTPFGPLVLAAIEKASEIRHQIYGNGGFTQLDFFGAGMAPKALGAAVHILETAADKYQIGSVVAMNLAIGDQSVAKLSRDYTGRRTTGEAAKIIIPPNYTKIPEPLMRREIDGRGAELAMRARQVKALINFRMVMAIMKAERGVEYIEKLLDGGATVTVANSLNEAMVVQTQDYLPQGDQRFHNVDIVGVEGKKPAMLANEHAGLVALVNAIGLRHHLRRIAA